MSAPHILYSAEHIVNQFLSPCPQPPPNFLVVVVVSCVCFLAQGQMWLITVSVHYSVALVTCNFSSISSWARQTILSHLNYLLSSNKIKFSLSLSVSLCVCLSLSHTHAHAHVQARMHAHTHRLSLSLGTQLTATLLENKTVLLLYLWGASHH